VPATPALGRRCDRWNLGNAGRLRNQLLDRNIPCHTADRHDGRLLAHVDLHDAARPVVTQARDDHTVAGLKTRFTDLVDNTRPDHGPGGPGLGHGHGPGGDDFAAAASYLGLTTAELETKLESGKTLAQIADATSGKSAAGLIDALVAAETTELDNALKAGTITQAQHDQMVAGLKARFTAMANGTRPADAPPRYANPGTAQNAPRI